MENPVLFSEKQGFKQWWMWLIFIAINLLFIFGIVTQIIYGEQFGDNPMDDTGLIIISISFFLLSVLILSSKLTTQITKDGISVKVFPFHWKFRTYSWDEFSEVYVRQYSPIMEYGGWGLRYSMSGNGKAYNMHGNKGLQLVFKNGKRLLVGTQKMEELKGVLEKIGALR